jgi:NitT/TauT family transport system permease protein
VNAAALARSRSAPILLGIGTLAAFIALMQVLVETGMLNRFIVPPPSDVFLAFERVIVEEHIVDRFLLTMRECISAAALLAVFGISIGTLLYKVNILRQATETWVAAAASAQPC